MLSDVRFRLRAIFRREKVESELDEELRYHFDRQMERLIASGVSREEAARRAREAIGGFEQLKEDCRQARGITALEILAQDVRYAIRVLAKNPGVAAVASCTLAIGIGANTAVFSLVNRSLLRPLPYAEPESIVMLWGAGHTPFSEPTFLDYRDQNVTFENLAAVHSSGLALTSTDSPEAVRTIAVSSGFFDALRIRPLLGRTFLAAEGEPGRNNVLLLTYGAWLRRFGGDPLVLGRTMTFNLQPYTIVGVLPAGFDFSIPGYIHAGEFYTPMVLSRDERKRNSSYLRVIGRLKRGASQQQALADLHVIDRRLASAYPQILTGSNTTMVPLWEQTVGGIRRVLLVLLGAVSFVLLIACANVANLQLARASGRAREIAIRSALGAGRRRVIGQLLTESVLLAAIGGVLGLGLAGAALRVAVRFAPPGERIAMGIDWMAMGYCLAISLAAGVLFGFAPALQSAAQGLVESLKQGGRTAGDGGGRLRSVLIVAEIALSLVLLAGAGLLIRSFVLLRAVRPGFETDRVLTLLVRLPAYAFHTDSERVAFYQRTLGEIGLLPGVQAAGGVDDLPLTHDRDSGALAVEGGAPTTVDKLPVAQQRSVTPGYFRAMGIPLIAGRTFSETDTAESSPVILINQSLARHVFAGVNPIGKRIAWGMPGANSVWMTIVGVTGDLHDLSLDATPVDETYQPFTQATLPYMNVVIRTAGEPSALIRTVRETCRRLDKTLPWTAPQTMDEVLAESIAGRRFQMLLLTVFAAIALLLASVGIYGVVSYSVAQRRSEIGLRMALGASPSHVMKLIVGRSLLLASIGLAVGLIAAIGLTEFLSSMLFGVRAFDPLTFGGVSLLLVLVALLASYIPARRALRLDPVTALRNE